MAEQSGQPPRSPELRQAFARHWGAFANIAVFSVVMNILLLTGPLFMLQVYDRVLASRSSATLLVLFAIVVFLYAKRNKFFDEECVRSSSKDEDSDFENFEDDIMKC